MNYLLDTCVLSEYVKKQPNTAVIDWLDQQKEDDFLISIVSIGELKKGIIKLEQSQPIRSQRVHPSYAMSINAQVKSSERSDML